MLRKTGLFAAIERKESRDCDGKRSEASEARPAVVGDCLTAFLLSITIAELTASNSYHIENDLKTRPL